MHSTDSTPPVRQWQPTLEEAARVMAVLGQPEGYPRRSRFGGRLRRVP